MVREDSGSISKRFFASFSQLTQYLYFDKLRFKVQINFNTVVIRYN